MKKNYFIILGFISIYASCCRTLQCTNTGVSLNDIEFIDFNKTEISTVIVRRFTEGSNFAFQTDSIILSTTDAEIDSLNDTTYNYEFLSIPNFYPFQITIGYDYEIFIPATNTLTKIDSILEPQTTEQSCVGGEYQPQSCMNPITSYSQNGQQLTGGFYTPIVINK